MPEELFVICFTWCAGVVAWIYEFIQWRKEVKDEQSQSVD